MSASRPPFELHAQTVPSPDNTAQTFYSYTLNPESGVPAHWCGPLRTTGCHTAAAAERFVRQRIEELKRGAPDTERWSDCSALLDDPERLRSVAAERGYLFFRALLPAQTVLEVRHDVLGVLGDHGALADGSETDAGIAKPGLVLEGSNPTDQYRAYYNKVLSVHSFNALPHHPRIMAVVEQLVGDAVLVHPRHICHAIFPAPETFKTPPHQDHFSVGGTPATWTVWLPLGDCDSALGGVMLAEGSHADGLLPVVEGSIWVDPGTERRWTWSPMAAGDVVMFHSLAVHQGRDNTSGDRIRLAASFRYQPVSEPVDEAALKPQHRYAAWDELYADWPPDDPLRYYWRDLPLQVQPTVHP